MAVYILSLLLLISSSCFGQSKTYNYYQIIKDSSTNYTYVLDSSGKHVTAFNSNRDSLWSTYVYAFHNGDGSVCCMEFHERPGRYNNNTKTTERVIKVRWPKCAGYIFLSDGAYYLEGNCD